MFPFLHTASHISIFLIYDTVCVFVQAYSLSVAMVTRLAARALRNWPIMMIGREKL